LASPIEKLEALRKEIAGVTDGVGGNMKALIGTKRKRSVSVRFCGHA